MTYRVQPFGLVFAVAMLNASLPLRADYIDGMVSSSMFATSFNAKIETHGPVSAASPGSTYMPSNVIATVIEDVTIDVAITDISANQKQVDIVWYTESGLPFIAPNTTLQGFPISKISWTVGVDISIPYPWQPANPYEDPDFDHIESAVSRVYSDSGALLANYAPYTVEYDTGWGGGLGFALLDINGNELPMSDITAYRAQRFEVTVVYETVPEPNAVMLLGLGISVAAFRRTRRQQ